MVSGLLGYLSQSCAFAQRHTFFFAVYLCIIYSSLGLFGDGIAQLLTRKVELANHPEGIRERRGAMELSRCAFLKVMTGGLYSEGISKKTFLSKRCQKLFPGFPISRFRVLGGK